MASVHGEDDRAPGLHTRDFVNYFFRFPSLPPQVSPFLLVHEILCYQLQTYLLNWNVLFHHHLLYTIENVYYCYYYILPTTYPYHYYYILNIINSVIMIVFVEPPYNALDRLILLCDHA